MLVPLVVLAGWAASALGRQGGVVVIVAAAVLFVVFALRRPRTTRITRR